MTKSSPPKPSLVSVRSLLIIITALFAGTAVGLLTFVSAHNAAAAIVAAIMTFGATVVGLHALVEP